MSGSVFKRADHTLIVSDLHLTEEEKVDPKRPMWKRWKQKDLFIDEAFSEFLLHMESEINGPLELILAGDIFDFDSVTAIPADPKFPVDFIERRRGLNPDEKKSLFKFNRIIDDHPVWFAAVRDFVSRGHRVIFIIGNHDLELTWNSVRNRLLNELQSGRRSGSRVRICDLYYISNEDTLIEHGNQHDAYCVTQNPLWPYIQKGDKPTLRRPFGNLASHFLLNGMGYFNPHVEATFLMSFREYLSSFFKYVWRTQPLLMFSWFWSSMVTMLVALTEAMLPAVQDPLLIEKQTEKTARLANSNPAALRSMLELKVYPAVFRPWLILRELWLDRALIIILLLYLAFQAAGVMNIIFDLSMLWVVLPVVVTLPFFLLYTRSVKPKVKQYKQARLKNLKLAAKIVDVRRIVNGHTHQYAKMHKGGIDFFNAGYWSAPCLNIECTRKEENRTFVWIRPGSMGEREAVLAIWRGGRIGYEILE